MASSPDDRDLSPPSEAIQRLILAQFQADWVDRLSVDQMFVLIDGVLPFEACLYYQVLPLFLEGNRLHLGMVSPEDASAVDYVRRIISYVNYSLLPRQISSEALRVVLTAYLNYAGKKSAGRQSAGRQSVDKQQVDQNWVGTKPPVGAQALDQEAFKVEHSYYSARAKLEQEANPNDRKTLIVDSPEYLNDSYLEVTASTSAPLQKPRTELPAAPLPLNVPLLESLPVLAVQAHHPENSLESLAGLPPHDLLQELLARVIARGIGRLYFECHVDYGRILWSQDGVLQSVLDQLPLPLFQSIVNALKQLMQLALEPVDALKQVEAEYLYDRQRILLRCRFMPNGYGEEATLQVLRGAALKFYQQQQVSKLERDALGIAKQLQNKLKEIRDRACAEPGLISAKFDVLPALSQFLQAMEEKPNHLGMYSKKAEKEEG
jgi:type II secretory ATPase GspE/PulE/Tfp pilus assembly ATPase PilB-like protein